MQKALEISDTTRLERAAHSLKGELGCIAAPSVMEHARALEDAGRSGELGAVGDLMNALQTDLRQLRRELLVALEVNHEAALGR